MFDSLIEVIANINIWHLIFLILIGLGAGFVQRVSGFGLGIFAMLFMPYFIPTTSATAISSLFSCGTSSYNAICYRKNIPFKTVLPLICSALVTIPVAVSLSAYVPKDVFKIILGAVLIVLSIYFIFFNRKLTIKPTILNGVIAGAVGGALGGLFSTGGPPIVLYLTHATDDKERYFAGIQFYFCFSNIYATITRIFKGIIDWTVLLYAVVGFAGCMLGDFVGKFFFNKLDPEKFKLVIYIGMIVSGIIMIVTPVINFIIA